MPAQPAVLLARSDDLEQAVELSQGGDPSAFSAVVLATAPRLFRLAVRILGGTADAEDVLQESYVRAFDALRARQFERKSSVQTWLYRIVTNTALDLLRARERHPLPPPRGEVHDGSQAALARARLAELGRWLAELPAEQRVALVLKELEGLSAKEVAEVLECSEGAVEQRLVRARAALRARDERD